MGAGAILFLDDSPERTKVFKSKIPSAITVATAAECIQYLADSMKLGWSAWEWVFLDHDLGGSEFADSSQPDTGMEVVRWIVANQPVIKTIVVHSVNAAASLEMTRTLREAGYQVLCIPFAWKYAEKLCYDA